MKTFCVQTLGCKVNQYESEQLSALLRARGLVETSPERAELRIINSCSVTVQAASQSRQAARRMIRLPVLSDARPDLALPQDPSASSSAAMQGDRRVIVTGCWATSDKASALSIAGIDAVLTHQDDVAAELDRLLTLWRLAKSENGPEVAPNQNAAVDSPHSALNDGWMIKAGSGAGDRTSDNRAKSSANVNEIPHARYVDSSSARGANSLPLLGEHQSGRQRAFLKIQDGCDAHCTYCIIPQLRPALHSKPVSDTIEEAKRLVSSGHAEIVLTGIFLGAYGQPTSLRRRQPGGDSPLGDLVETLCEQVPGLKRLRLSSLEPGDLTPQLLSVLSRHEQVVPHFHLPLQSGSDELLRKMNRQYRRDDFLRMIDQVREAFDRPALTTDIIVGFPGESDAEFERTVEVVEHSRFIHVHAFPFSPRPGTAAARWKDQFVHGPAVNERIS
ncbi:MAG TPA: radical SAM protein, partial [Tepidisphaeraceae bacterium]|nr:radical SAM protein [Tepidisphaeraceae bacterium]